MLLALLFAQAHDLVPHSHAVHHDHDLAYSYGPGHEGLVPIGTPEEHYESSEEQGPHEHHLDGHADRCDLCALAARYVVEMSPLPVWLLGSRR